MIPSHTHIYKIHTPPSVVMNLANHVLMSVGQILPPVL